MKKAKIISFILAVLLTAGNMSSCLPAKRGEGLENDSTNTYDVYEEQEDTRLTGVFTESAIKFDKSLTPIDKVNVCTSDEKITFYCTSQAETDGNLITEHYLCEVDTNGDIKNTEKLNIDEFFYANLGLVTDDKVYLIYAESRNATADSTNILLVYDRSDRSIAKVEGIEIMFPDTGEPFTYISSIAVDGDGYVYLLSDNRICVLNPDLGKAFDFLTSRFQSSLSTDKSGVVYVTSYLGTYAIDRESCGLGEELPLPDVAEVKKVYFGDGYDCYYSSANGLYGFSDGMGGGELVMNWQNSGLNPTRISYLSVISPEKIFLSYVEMNNNESQYYNSFFAKSDDVDLSDTTKVSVAYLSSVLSPLPQQVINYNRKNPEKRVITEDYASYNSKENNWSGARTKLINDMLNGTYIPDVICVESSDRIISEILENELYLDLYTMIENDPDIEREDIVGAVKNTFEIDGRLSAVTPSFKLQTVLAPKSAVDDMTSWTLDELLDFEKNLDEGVLLTKDKNILFGGESSYSEFINFSEYTCDFNNPTFIKLIEYLSEEQEDVVVGSNRYAAYQTGKIILAQKEYVYVDSYSSDEVIYNSKDYVRIGYPTKSGNGSVISDAYVYIIPKNAAHSEEAWDFVRSVILDKPQYEMMSKNGIRMLKSQNESYKDDMKDVYMFYPFEGGARYWSGFRENNLPDENGRLDGKAGVYIEYREEDFDNFMKFVDASGMPASESIPSDVMDIIYEEITAYQGGLRTAEDTAMIIQSRVSIWLAERK